MYIIISYNFIYIALAIAIIFEAYRHYIYKKKKKKFVEKYCTLLGHLNNNNLRIKLLELKVKKNLEFIDNLSCKIAAFEILNCAKNKKDEVKNENSD
jgi:hypothetical protein